MLRGIIAFEIRYNFRNPVFWVAVAVFFLMGFGISASESVSLGTPGSVHENSPYAIAVATTVMTLFYLFIVAAFCASAIVRDEQAGFSPVIRATGVDRHLLIIGRFVGGLLMAWLGFAAIPLGISVGAMMPWVDPETVGPQVFSYYAWNYVLFALPNIFLTSALLFSLAAGVRSMMGAYLGAVAFVTGYFITTGAVGQNIEHRQAFARFEPLGLGALVDQTRYWTGDELNSRLVTLSGDLLINRIFAILLGVIILGIAVWRYRMGERPLSKRKTRKAEKAARKADRIAAVEPTWGGEKVVATKSRFASLVQFWTRTRVEMRQVLTSPGLIVLTLFAMTDISSLLWMGESSYGTVNHPTVSAVIETVQMNFTVILLMIAAFYGGELVWRERDRQVSEILDSTPAPAWVMTVPKAFALFLVLILINLAAMATGLIFQFSRGATEYGLSGYLAWFVVPYAVDLLLIAVLAVFFQVLSPSKYVGWGLLFGWFIIGIFLDNLGYSDPLFTYSASSEVPLSDFQGAGSFAWASTVMKFYWAMAAGILMVIAHLIWPRGTDLSLRVRIRQAIRRPKRVPLAIAAAAAVGMVASGIYIYRNTHIVNRFRTPVEQEEYLAGYEREYLKYESLAQPSVTDVKLSVELFPEDRRMLAEGSYSLVNDSGQPIRDLHVRRRNRDLEWLKMTVPGARLVHDDAHYGYRIYRFATPLAPGSKARVDFTSQLWRRGFAAIPSTDILENGTFLNNYDIAPVIGMDRRGLLDDRVKRRRQGLPDELRLARLEDERARAKNYVGADWVTLDIRLATDADQIGIAPGSLVEEDVAMGRRMAHFRSDAPILNFYSIQSARYEKARESRDGVELEVYYHPGHDWNVTAMLNAMGRSLDYYRENFGPYQFDYARIIEFPRYRSFAQAFAGTMPYSEALGFVADTDDPDDIDFTSYVVAHEMAHQYWAHQAVGAAVQGGTMTTETLAQYSALMVMKRMYGPDKIRRFLKYELDRYLAGRQVDVLDEQPLMRVEEQAHIHYRKGSLAMYLLQEELGEAAVNRALSRYLAANRFKGAPYPRSTDIIAEFRKEATTPAQQKLISDLFERITLYDLAAKEASSEKQGDEWVTRFKYTAAKFEANGKGRERAVPLDAQIEVGLFDARPGLGAFDRKDVIRMEKVRVTSGEGELLFRTKRRPEYVGIDPYNFRIDRESDDNIVKVGSGD